MVPAAISTVKITALSDVQDFLGEGCKGQSVTIYTFLFRRVDRSVSSFVIANSPEDDDDNHSCNAAARIVPPKAPCVACVACGVWRSLL